MFLSIQQKFILEALKKLGCVRRGQLHALVRGRFEQADFPVTQHSMDAMLRQLRVGSADVRLDDELVWLSGAQPDARRLEAVDVMIELTGGKIQALGVYKEPPDLLCFAYNGNKLRLFTVASLDLSPPEHGRKSRIIWISDSGAAPDDLLLPPRHFFAARQPDGTHRFYGSKGL